MHILKVKSETFSNVLQLSNLQIAAALSQALSRDRVFVPQNFELAEFKVERTIDNDYLIVRK